MDAVLDGIWSRLHGNDVPIEVESSPTLRHVRDTFNLSPFECALLALCAGPEFRPEFHEVFQRMQGPERGYPTMSLALSVLSDPTWTALAPDSPLRRWRLIEVGKGLTLTQSPLKIDEWVLHLLAGTEATDERLIPEIAPLEAEPPSTEGQAAVAKRLARAWEQGYELAQLFGPDPISKAAVVRGAAEAFRWRAMRAQAPVDPALFSVLWERHAAVIGAILVADEDDFEGAKALMERVRGPRVLFSRDRRTVSASNSLAFEVNLPTPQDQRRLWVGALGDRASTFNGTLDRLVGHFTLSPESIRRAADEALASGEEEAVWQAARNLARLKLEELAQRIEPVADWDDLVLPEEQTATLRQICAQVRQRGRVYDDWGFGGPGARGLGISALFSGPSGTGKTFAAEVIAHEMGLDLFRIDLASVVSKYIGETEKNLRRIFDAAESGGAILLFDEADALFGKRSEVKDSHDRYANIEVSYLLQRIEAFRGLAILTTNLRSSFDAAFLRRIRFVVEFPFPDAEHRTRLWEKAFTKKTPTDSLLPERLAQMNLTGGSIRSVALNAAFQAADEGEPVAMRHIFASARAEYQKLERPMTDSETRGWA